MEEDRLATNLGPDQADDLEADVVAALPQQPKRRFVGRRAAEKAAMATTGASNTNIEENSAVQGTHMIYLKG